MKLLSGSSWRMILEKPENGWSMLEVIMVLYTIMGGLLAVAYTDLIQTVIMLAAVGIVLPLFIIADVGGAVSLDFLTPQSGNFWGGLTPIYIISIILIDLPFSIIDPSLWQSDQKHVHRRLVKILRNTSQDINGNCSTAIRFFYCFNTFVM